MTLRSTLGLYLRTVPPARVALAVVVLACSAGAQQPPADQPRAPVAGQSPGADPLVERLKNRVARVGGLTAEEASRRAVATSNADRSQRADVDVADSEVDRAKVGYFPRLSVTARYTRLSPISPPALQGLGGPFAANPALTSTLFPIILDQYMVQAGVLVPLSDYILRIKQSHLAAAESKEAALLMEEALRRAVSTKAKIQYYAWAAARMEQAVTEQSVEQAERHLDFATAGRDTGRTPNVEVLRTESLLSSSKLLDERAKNLALLAEAELRTMLHDPPERTYEIGEDLLAPVDSDEPGDNTVLFAEALRLRPDMRAFAHTDQSLENQRSVTNASGAPRLDGFGNAYLANPNPRVIPLQEQWKASWDLGVQLTWSPNDFGTSGASARGFDARRRKVDAERAVLADSVRDEIAGAVLAWKESRSAAGTAQRGLEAAEEAYRVRQDLYELGRGTNVELIDSESDVLRARLAMIRAKVDAKIARVRLEHAVGRDSLR